jgi:hypothetical protein
MADKPSKIARFVGRAGPAISYKREGEKRDKELYKKKALLGSLLIPTSSFGTDI